MIKNLYISIFLLLIFIVLIKTINNEENKKDDIFKTKAVNELQNNLNDLFKKYYKIEKVIIKLNTKYDNLSKFIFNFGKIKKDLVKKVENIQKYILDFTKYFNTSFKDFTSYFKNMVIQNKVMKSLNFGNLFKKAKESLIFNPFHYIGEKIEKSINFDPK